MDLKSTLLLAIDIFRVYVSFPQGHPWAMRQRFINIAGLAFTVRYVRLIMCWAKVFNFPPSRFAQSCITISHMIVICTIEPNAGMNNSFVDVCEHFQQMSGDCPRPAPFHHAFGIKHRQRGSVSQPNRP